MTQNAFEIIDLSVPLSEGMPKYEANWFPEFRIREVRPESMAEAAWKRRFTRLELFAHNATHVETSDHVFRDGRTISKLSLNKFVGHPYVIQLTDVLDRTEISRADLELRLPAGVEAGAIVLLHTSYDDRHWGQAGFWDNSPWLSAQAAEFLRDLRPAFLGLDFQTEKPKERDFVVHRTLLAEDMVLCEYLFNLCRVKPSSLLVALPIFIEGVEASPGTSRCN